MDVTLVSIETITATFVGFQIAVFAYVVLRIFTYTSPSSPSLTPSERLVNIYTELAPKLSETASVAQW